MGEREAENGGSRWGAFWRSLGRPPVTGALPRVLRRTAWVIVPFVYLSTAALLAAIIALNPDDWLDLMLAESSPFVWLSCSLLLAAGLFALMIALLHLLPGRVCPPSRSTMLAWAACGGALLLADLDERFRLHERVTLFLGLGRSGELLASIHPLMILYLLCACAFAVVVFRRYRPCPPVAAIFGVGVACFALSIVAETQRAVIPVQVTEELLELAAEASLVASFVLALLHELADLVKEPSEGEDPPTVSSACQEAPE